MKTHQTIVESYLKTKPLTPEIRGAIDDLLKKNPDIVQTYLNSQPLYHVCLRNEDEYLDPKGEFDHEIRILATFTPSG